MMLNFPKIKTGLTFSGLAPDAVPFALAQIFSQDKEGRPLIFITSDNANFDLIQQNLRFYGITQKIIKFPAWDCLPYDRMGPNSCIIGQRIKAQVLLAQMLKKKSPQRYIILTSISAVMQHMVSFTELLPQIKVLRVGQEIAMEDLISDLLRRGYVRVPKVSNAGEYAVRGGLIDIFVNGFSEPYRVDFFGDQIETIRQFSSESQKTIASKDALTLLPVYEVALAPENIATFKKNYVKNFGNGSNQDLIYENIANGQAVIGMEHYLPLFYKKLANLFDYSANSLIVCDHNIEQFAKARDNLISDYYKAREQQNLEDKSNIYRALAPSSLYISYEELYEGIFKRQGKIDLVCFRSNLDLAQEQFYDFNIKLPYSFASDRKAKDVNLFDSLINYLKQKLEEKFAVILVSNSAGSRARLKQALKDHDYSDIIDIDRFEEIKDTNFAGVYSAVFPLEYGFICGDILFLTEKDIFGEILSASAKKTKRGANYISNASKLSVGDIVVHILHGIGRFAGLQTIEALGLKHDFLELHYAGEDKLFIPVENVDLLTRYGGENTHATLDKLGSLSWQNRKAKLKKQLLAMAGDLINIAAQRQLKSAPVMIPPAGSYDEFVARFPYEETEDQAQAIKDVISDLQSGRPMDRLICGDVGFGKTEVCLRAAFIAAICGYQVALIVPTILLARQHYQNFCKRFESFGIKITHLSRLVGTAELKKAKQALANGDSNIVIGTHALLSADIKFANLGLLIIDEEHHFGVKHKEKLKQLRENVHVLSLSATPIPRTLQFSLMGIKELSLINTPPCDRLAVRSFVAPFDVLSIREMLLREHYRGGQSFFVCPRISDLIYIERFLQKNLPELKIAVAHGQMPLTELEEIMNNFYDAKFDVLLSTTIIESGIDIPTANTLIVYRADMFGLAALYQLRGRVGRSKQRAYALFCFSQDKILTKQAEKRLRILQDIEALGGGLQIANHDLDIRGAGNLLGEEQSGHIKEVGYELYQQMLEDAILHLKDSEITIEEKWAPQINIGSSVLIPESYVNDIDMRLNLYKRLSDLESLKAIEDFKSELIDRFGTIPAETENLLKIIYIKLLCKKANIEKAEAGNKGLTISFRNNQFPAPDKLFDYITKLGQNVKFQQNQDLCFYFDGNNLANRLNFTIKLLKKLISLI